VKDGSTAWTTCPCSLASGGSVINATKGFRLDGTYGDALNTWGSGPKSAKTYGSVLGAMSRGWPAGFRHQPGLAGHSGKE
jgi:hypothetical protein